MLNINPKEMNIRNEIEELLTKEYGWFDPKKVDELLGLNITILSEILDEAEKKATEIDNGKSEHSLGESQGFESGAEWAICRMEDKLLC